MPLELRAGIAIYTDTNEEAEDGAHEDSAIDSVRRGNNLPQRRQHTPNQLLILDDLKLSKVSVDKITQFSLKLPEFIELLENLGEYHRWLCISKKKTKARDLPLYLSASLDLS